MSNRELRTLNVKGVNSLPSKRIAFVCVTVTMGEIWSVDATCDSLHSLFFLLNSLTFQTKKKLEQTDENSVDLIQIIRHWFTAKQQHM